MKTLLPALTISLSLSLSLVAACGNNDGEDLNLDSLPVLTTADEKSDKAGAASFFWVRQSSGPVACIAAPCPTAMLNQVNTPDARLIYKYDWRGLKLTSSEQQRVSDEASSLLLYGKYTSAKAFGQPVTVFQVTRANEQVSAQTGDNISSDTYYSVKAETTPCMGGSCPTLEIAMLGGGIVGPLHIMGTDLARLGIAPTVEATLTEELKAGNDYLSITGIKNSVAAVSQAFRPVGSNPLK